MSQFECQCNASEKYYNRAQCHVICRRCGLPWAPPRATEQPQPTPSPAATITCPACIAVNAAFAGFEDGAPPRPSPSCRTCGGSGITPAPTVDGPAGVGVAPTLPAEGSLPLSPAVAPQSLVSAQPAEVPATSSHPAPHQGASAGVVAKVVTISSYVADKGRRMFETGAVHCLSLDVYQVTGDTGEHLVDFLRAGAPRCNCTAGLRGIDCSHVEAVRLWADARLAKKSPVRIAAQR